MSEQHFDCLVIGAGISGINAAYHLQKYNPWATYKVLERRSNLGGTWDLFRYPGIRSDSDMFTFGFSWKVWKSPKAIAPGEDILAYLTEAAKEHGIIDHIRFNTDIKTADWKSSDNQWHLVTTGGDKYTCRFLIGATGYYSYESPHIPHFPGQEDFKGTLVHPQFWKAHHDTEIVGKKVAIIGSGATAVTILPNISERVEHVTMVQRTPTYIGVKPDKDKILLFLSKIFPESLAAKINRWVASVLMVLIYNMCITFPNRAKKIVKGMMYGQLKGSMSEDEFEKHFNPPYNPWEQRFCLAPEGDFFKALRTEKASVVTGHIEKFTENGVLMKDGSLVEADFIVVATGLTMGRNIPFSTITTKIDGEDYQPSKHLIYKGCMLEDIPNMGFVVGYTNASWTLKADIASMYFSNVLNYMNDNQIVKLTPREDKSVTVVRSPFNGGLSSSYLNRDAPYMPTTGDKGPWVNPNNYLYDLFQLWVKPFKPESMELVKKNVEVKKSK